MTRAKVIGYAIPWVLFVSALVSTNLQISEIMRTRKIMIESNSSRISTLENRVVQLETLLLAENARGEM